MTQDRHREFSSSHRGAGYSPGPGEAERVEQERGNAQVLAQCMRDVGGEKLPPRLRGGLLCTRVVHRHRNLEVFRLLLEYGEKIRIISKIKDVKEES